MRHRRDLLRYPVYFYPRVYPRAAPDFARFYGIRALSDQADGFYVLVTHASPFLPANSRGEP
jgi:hypothetical protein